MWQLLTSTGTSLVPYVKRDGGLKRLYLFGEGMPVTDTEPPTTPTGLGATSVTHDSVSLTWDPSTDNTSVVGYHVRTNGASATNVTATSITVSGLTPGTLYSFTVAAYDAEGNTSPQSDPLAVITSAQPLAAYNFDEGAGLTAADSSGMGQSLTLPSADWWASGHTGTGVSNPNDGTLLIPTTGLETPARTLMFWALRHTEGIGWGVEFHAADADTGAWGILPDLNGSAVGRIRIDGGNENLGVPALPIGEWHHYAITYEDGAFAFYVDGVAVSSSSTSGTIDAASEIRVDADVKCRIDDIRIYGQALPASQIPDLMNTPVT